MSYLTVEVEIDHGRVGPRGLARRPEKGRGLLPGVVAPPVRQRVELPLIHGAGHRIIDEPRGPAGTGRKLLCARPHLLSAARVLRGL